MGKAKGFVAEFLAVQFAVTKGRLAGICISSCKLNALHASKHLSTIARYLYSRDNFLKAIFAILLFLLSGCDTIIIVRQTPLPSRLPFSHISEENAVNLRPIREWRLLYVNAIAWSIDSITFAVAGDDGENSDIYAYNIFNSKIIWSNDALTPLNLIYHPNNRIVAVPHFEGISLFDSFTGGNVGQIDHDLRTDGHPCIGRNAIKFSPDGGRIITLDTHAEYGTTSIYVWDAITDQCLGLLTEEDGVAFDFELSDDGKFLVLGLSGVGKDYEQQVHVWNVETRQPVCVFRDGRPIAFTSDGNIVATANIDNEGEVNLWDAKSCQYLDTLHRQEQKGPYSMDFSPDGRLLAIGGSESFQIWGVAHRKLLFESDKLPNRVNVLVFSPDGRFLLSKTDRKSVDDKAIITLWGVSR